MNVVTSNGIATIMLADGVMHSVPYTALGRADMLLQAKYHHWAREHEYRRALVCRRCKEDFDVESNVNEEDQAWELLMVCTCRAMYGKVSLSDIASAMTNWHSSATTNASS